MVEVQTRASAWKSAQDKTLPRTFLKNKSAIYCTRMLYEYLFYALAVSECCVNCGQLHTEAIYKGVYPLLRIIPCMTVLVRQKNILSFEKYEIMPQDCLVTDQHHRVPCTHMPIRSVHCTQSYQTVASRRRCIHDTLLIRSSGHCSPCHVSLPDTFIHVHGMVRCSGQTSYIRYALWPQFWLVMDK